MEMIKEFYGFMLARETIRLMRLTGAPREQWTDDKILHDYKFTNVKREHDRTTRNLKNEIYDKRPKSAMPDEILLNCAIYRFFGTYEMACAVGWSQYPQSDEDMDRLVQLLIDTSEARMREKLRVFTGAYMIPNCGDSRPKAEVVADIIRDIWQEIPATIDAYMFGSWQRLCESLQKSKGVGAFMAKEVALDFILATNWMPNDWATWTPVGPGARRGIARVCTQGGHLLAPYTESKALKLIQTLWAQRGDHWPKHWHIPNGSAMCTPASDMYIPDASAIPLNMVDLSLTDIQFQLCEFDKYMRAKLGDGRPKAKFTPTKE